MDREKLTLHIRRICLSESEEEQVPLFHEAVFDPDEAARCLVEQSTVHACLIVDGVCVHRVRDQVIPCRAGDIHIVPPNTPHAFFAVEGCDMLSVEELTFHPEEWLEGEAVLIGNPRYCYGVFGDGAVVGCAMLNERMQGVLSRLLRSIEEEAREQGAEWRDAVQAYLMQLLITVGRYINSSIKKHAPISSKDWSLVHSVIKLIREHYGDYAFTMDRAADAVYVSRAHLSRLFKGLTGKVFSDYLRDVRIENACRLLRETNMNVDEIVEQCGMRDIHSFYRLFGARLHMTPRQYRQAMLDEEKQRNGSGGEATEMELLNEISESLRQGRTKPMKERIRRALEHGVAPLRILDGLLSGMNVICEQFKNNEVFVPEVLVASHAMNQGTQMIKPYFAGEERRFPAKVCIGTVRGDLHDIGKNLVKMMMESKGLEVIDLGVDVAPESFVRAVVEDGCRLVCCSALLSTTVHAIKDVLAALEAAGVRNRVKVMIGGAPVTQEFCERIGADRYTVDAASAADAAVELMEACFPEDGEQEL